MRKHKLILNGKEVTPAEFHRGGKVGGDGVPMVSRPYLVVSESLGVLPNQVPEARKLIASRGLSGVKIQDNGAARITSKGDTGHVGLLKLRGKQHEDGGYGTMY